MDALEQHTKRAASVAHTLPAAVAAGEPVRWSLRLRPGRAVPAGARFGLARNWPSDWGRPQWSDPLALNYLAATASGGARIALSAGRRPEWHPYDHGIVLTFLDPIDPRFRGDGRFWRGARARLSRRRLSSRRKSISPAIANK